MSAPRPLDGYLSHAIFRAAHSPAGIGAATVESLIGNEHTWDCIVTDGSEWHYVRVLGRGVGPFPNVSAEDVEESLERFAASLPEDGRLRHLVNLNPLHIDRERRIDD